MKLMLIDANNLAYRVAFIHNNLSIQLPIPPDARPDDIEKYSFPTGVLFGFFRMLAMLRRNYPSYYLALLWDGGYKKRLELTKEAVAQRLIPAAYKQNRKDAPMPQVRENLYKQTPELRAMLSLTNIPQVSVPGEEADDVAGTYAKKYESVAEDIIFYTNDRDYLQLLRNNVRILIKDQLLDANLFSALRHYSPNQVIDVGALQGDSSDNIFGVPGFGEKTAEEKIREFGSLEAMLEAYHKELDPLRVIYPDLTGDKFQELKDAKTPKDGLKWPDINQNTPFTGVALALENRLIKKPKVMVSALMFEERAKLAKVLKTINSDLEVPDFPGWNGTPAWNRQGKAAFLDYCAKYRLNEISAVRDMLCAPQS